MTPIARGQSGRFAILPLFGVALLGLALALRASVGGSGSGTGQLLLAAVVAVYLIVAAVLGRLTWRSPVLFGAMIAAHAAVALVFGFALSAGDVDSRSVLGAWEMGLWNFAPAPLLVAALCVAGGGLMSPLLGRGT